MYPILQTLKQTDQPAVLATILEVAGSSYRKQGTSMLFLDDGRQVGILSGGCLETDLAARVPRILQEGEPFLWEYDLRHEEDWNWGQGSGCNGRILVIMEVVDPHMREFLTQANSFLEEGIPVVMAKEFTLDRERKGFGMFPLKKELIQKELTGTWHGECSANLQEWIKIQISAEKPMESGFHRLSAGNASIFTQVWQPRPRLIIWGGGNDAKPLVAFAAAAGFQVIVADWRPDFCHAARFPEAEQCLIGFPAQIVNQLACTSRDFVLLMSHHFQKDQEFLRLLLEQPLQYLGILGSRDRIARVFQSQNVPEYVHAPVGLSIGAEGPEEIAVSILAEMIQKKNTNRR
ncbi:XdhC family protein [Fodinisporobacter ferrooxydans]|uniref:XdhC family protein n=1 Tax=Fodinisporobacter ferrooxydans TaxID=2901836 RepID=A0ABY4CR92_9BACL|nr:XdhC family protein [Alicyclobacillaceae bacterium MYW30-H2]